MEISITLISIIVFYALVGGFFWKNRKKVEFHKILLLYRTKYGLNFIERISKFKIFWKYFGYLGILTGFVGMIFILYVLIKQLIKLAMAPEVAGKSVQLVVPWTMSGSSGPFLLIPFWYFIISLIIVIFVHEGAHGIVARAHNLKLKSTGVGMLFVLPLAFVEPDEKQLFKSDLKKQLSVYAAGTAANFVTALIALALILFVVTPWISSTFDENGVEIVGVTEGMPGELAGIQIGDIIHAVNGVETKTTSQFISELEKVSPGDEVRLLFSDRELVITTIENPENKTRAHIGIQFQQNTEINKQVAARYGNKLPQFPFYLHQLLYWILILNVGIGLINLLPIGPIDGGRMLKAILANKLKNKKLAKKLFSLISTFSLWVLLLNFIGPLIF